MTRKHMTKYLLGLLLLLLCHSLSAQELETPSRNPAAEVKQEVGLTEITLSYFRPSANGSVVFGDIVPFDEIWQTGAAKAATKITFTEAVKIAGNDLEAGTYALYTIPGRQEWTIIIHRNTDLKVIDEGLVKPENDAFRFKSRPLYNPHYVETFSIQFTDVNASGCQLELAWGNTTVKFPVTVGSDAEVEARIAAIMGSPASVSGRSYFRAAKYYFDNDKDLTEALGWVNLALAREHKKFRYGLLKSEIQAARGDTDLAIETIKTAREWAVALGNAKFIAQADSFLAELEREDTSSDASGKYAADVSSLDNIMKALYSSISGEKGERRDWDRFQYLFTDEARLIPSRKDKEGKVGYRIMSPAAYVQTSGSWLEENGFHEVEISRKEEAYGSLVHVFSTYESYRSKSDETPFARGINSIQLMNDGERWWVMQIYWLGETEDLPLPATYLPEE